MKFVIEVGIGTLYGPFTFEQLESFINNILPDYVAYSIRRLHKIPKVWE